MNKRQKNQVGKVLADAYQFVAHANTVIDPSDCLFIWQVEDYKKAWLKKYVRMMDRLHAACELLDDKERQ